MQLFQIMQFGTAILIGILLAKSGLPTGQISVYEALLFVASLYCFFWIVGGQNALLQLYPKLDAATQARSIFNIYNYSFYGTSSSFCAEAVPQHVAIYIPGKR